MTDGLKEVHFLSKRPRSYVNVIQLDELIFKDHGKSLSIFRSLLVFLPVLLKKTRNIFRKLHDFPKDIIAVNPMSMD